MIANNSSITTWSIERQFFFYHYFNHSIMYCFKFHIILLNWKQNIPPIRSILSSFKQKKTIGEKRTYKHTYATLRYYHFAAYDIEQNNFATKANRKLHLLIVIVEEIHLVEWVKGCFHLFIFPSQTSSLRFWKFHLDSIIFFH